MSSRTRERWPALAPVLIGPLDGVPTVEFAYSTAWDLEHTLGARFREWTLLELNGSILCD